MHAMERRIWIDSRAKDSSKSMPSTWVYPWATNLDLFQITSPSSSVLFLNIHLELMTCVSLGLGTSSHTSFLTNWCNSWCMDSTNSHPSMLPPLSLVQTEQDSNCMSHDSHYMLVLSSTEVLHLTHRWHCLRDDWELPLMMVFWNWTVPHHERLEVELPEEWVGLKILVLKIGRAHVWTPVTV